VDIRNTLIAERPILEVLTNQDVQNRLRKFDLSPNAQSPISKIGSALAALFDKQSDGWLSGHHAINDVVDSVVWMSPRMLGQLHDYGDVVLVDCTQQTNAKGMYLLTIAVVDSNGRTQPVTYALLTTESEAAFSWVLRWIMENTQWRPSIVFSDGDLAIGRACRQIQVCGTSCVFGRFSKI
jgi:hypothetical protein